MVSKLTRICVATVLVIGAVILAYKERTVLEIQAKPVLMKIETAVSGSAPCTEPLTWKIGTLDSRFNLSQSRFIEDVNQAADIWDKASGKKIFQYSPNGDLTINLLYDYRQKTTTELNMIDTAITADKKTYDSLKSKYDSLVSAYNSSKAALDSEINAYNSAKQSYDQNVAYWNARGGAPPNEYDSLERQKQSLNSQAEAVNGDTTSLNDRADAINSLAGELNQLAKALNLNAQTYNKIGASTGREFDEGEYVSDSSGQRIDIYQYNNNAQLTRVLAHELGHALGLDHVSDPKAIMYYLNQSANEKPTAADLNELKAVCRLR